MPRFQPIRKRRGRLRGGHVAARQLRRLRGWGDGGRARLAEPEPRGVRVVVPGTAPAVDLVALRLRLLRHDVAMLATAMPDPSPLPVVGVDLGGTTVKAALVAPGFELGARGQEPTDLRSQRSLLDGIERLVEKVRGGADIGGVGFGLPSQIDQRHGRVLDSTNIPLEDLDFAEEMRRRLGYRCHDRQRRQRGVPGGVADRRRQGRWQRRHADAGHRRRRRPDPGRPALPRLHRRRAPSSAT